MAIAPLMEYEGMPDGTCGLLERPGTQAVLRVVPAVRRGGPPADDCGRLHAAPVGRRAAVLRRRRRVLLCALVIGLLVLLGLPLAALGGAPRGAHAPRAAVAGAVVYVVQPGDTLWSIASRFDHGGDPRPLAQAIAAETRSPTVVPGERIAIP